MSSRTGSTRRRAAGAFSSAATSHAPSAASRASARTSRDSASFVYVGDGFSDRCVAQAARRVFARDGLATYLAGKGVAFELFDDFYDVASALDGGAVVPPTRSRGRKT